MSEKDHTLPIGARLIPFASGYCVRDGGQVWGCRKPGPGGYTWDWRPLKPRKTRAGYFTVGLKFNGKQRHFLVHRLVLWTFVGPCPPGLQCRHLDGDPGNNRVENLKWGSKVEDAADRRRHGRAPVGEQNGYVRLKESDIVRIFQLYSDGWLQVELADLFEVTQVNISRILTRKSWKHVKVDVELGDCKIATRGERNGTAKMTDRSIVDVFRLSSKGLIHKEIAEIHGVSATTIDSILLRQTWSHVPVPAEYLSTPLRRPKRASKGEQNSRATLTDAAVIEMFRLRSEGVSGKEIADRIGTSQGNVSMILARKKWKHVPIPAEYLPRPLAT